MAPNIGCQPHVLRRLSVTQRRLLVYTSILSLSTVFLLVFFYWDLAAPRLLIGGLRNAAGPTNLKPPNWDRIRLEEQNLPQHDLDLRPPEGKDGRYVKFSNTWEDIGWNNVNHDMLFNAYLAHDSGRAYVFQDFVWKPSHYPWRVFGGLYHPRTPLSALLGGPVSGGSWPSGVHSPRSVSAQWFDVVCPLKDRRRVPVNEVKAEVQDRDAAEQFEHWKRFLSDAPEKCIEVMPVPKSVDRFPQIFDLYMTGSPKLLTLWDGFVQSPVSTGLKASGEVQRALRSNEHLFVGEGKAYERMMAVHLRKGDFSGHCKFLNKWGSKFFGWSQHTSLPDPLQDSDLASLEAVLHRCLPSTKEIISKILLSRQDYSTSSPSSPQLNTIYLMTNELGPWLDDLKSELRKHDFTTIVTNWDLRLDAEQTEVSIEVDMEIATRANVFIGNGWSSVASTLVYRRHLQGHEMTTTRFF